MTGNRSSSLVDSSEIISTGWQLYRRNWAQYVKISLWGYLWLLLPVVVFAIAIGALSVQVSADTFSNNISGIIGLLILATVAFFVISAICFAQFLGWTAGISRLVYQSLSEGVEDERAALRFTRSRKYSLLWQNLLRGFIFLGAYLAFGLIILVLTAIGFGLFGVTGFGGSGTTGLALAWGAVEVLVGLAFLVFVVWVGLRLMLADQSLVLEQDSSAWASISRSWAATKGNVLRSLQVVIFAFLISIPISLAFNITAQIIATILIGLAPASESLSADAGLGVVPFVVAVLVLLLGSFGAVIFTLPLWHAMLTTLYHRLQSEAVKVVGIGPVDSPLV